MRKIAFLAATAMPIAFDNAPAATAATKPERIAPVLTEAFKIDLPKRVTNRGSTSIYPFDTLTEVGQAIGVKNKTAKQLSTIVSNANKKRRIKKVDSNGNVVFKTNEISGPDGTKTVVPTQEPEMVAGVTFYAIDVDKEVAGKIKGTPLEGSKALIIREA